MKVGYALSQLRVSPKSGVKKQLGHRFLVGGGNGVEMPDAQRLFSQLVAQVLASQSRPYAKTFKVFPF